MLKGNSSFAGNLDIQLAQPVDGRQICKLKNDLYSSESWKASDGNTYLWKGMQTYVQETGEWYELISDPYTEVVIGKDAEENDITVPSYQLPSSWKKANEIFTKGANIDITNNVISAKGYFFDDTTKSFTEGYDGLGVFDSNLDAEVVIDSDGNPTNNFKTTDDLLTGTIIRINGEVYRIIEIRKEDSIYIYTVDRDYISSGGRIYVLLYGAVGFRSHSEGEWTQAVGNYSHAEGEWTQAVGNYSHAEGNSSHAEGDYSHAEGNMSNAKGESSHAEGYDSHAEGNSSHAEGYNSHAEGAYSHAEGFYPHAEGSSSHAEGYYSHAEGYNSHAEGDNSHAEGSSSHAEGYYSHAKGYSSHAEGNSSHAEGVCSHAEGLYTITTNEAEHTEGKFNKSNTGTISSIGIGNSADKRKNAFEVMKNGDVYIHGVGRYDGTNAVEVNSSGILGQSIQEYLSDNQLPQIENELIYFNENEGFISNQLLLQDETIIIDNQEDYNLCTKTEGIEMDVLGSWQQFQCNTNNDSSENSSTREGRYNKTISPEYGKGVLGNTTEADYPASGYGWWYNDGVNIKNDINSGDFNGYLIPFSKNRYSFDTLFGCYNGTTTGDQIGFSIVNDKNALPRRVETSDGTYYRNTLYDKVTTDANGFKHPTQSAWVKEDKINNTAKVIFTTSPTTKGTEESFPTIGNDFVVYDIENIQTSEGRKDPVESTTTVNITSTHEATGYLGFLTVVVTNSSSMELAQGVEENYTSANTGTIYVFGSVFDIKTQKWNSTKIIDGSDSASGDYWKLGKNLVKYNAAYNGNEASKTCIIRCNASYNNGKLEILFGNPVTYANKDTAAFNGSKLSFDFTKKSYSFESYHNASGNPTNPIKNNISLPNFTPTVNIDTTSSKTLSNDEFWNLFTGDTKFMYNAYSYKYLYIEVLNMLIDNKVIWVNNDGTCTEYGLNEKRTEYVSKGNVDTKEILSGSRLAYNPITKKLFYSNGEVIYQIAEIKDNINVDLSDYYTKTEVDTIVSNIEDKDTTYTAGENIEIENNSISAIGYIFENGDFRINENLENTLINKNKEDLNWSTPFDGSEKTIISYIGGNENYDFNDIITIGDKIVFYDGGSGAPNPYIECYVTQIEAHKFEVDKQIFFAPSTTNVYKPGYAVIVKNNDDVYIKGIGGFNGANFENSLTLQETIKNTINVVRVKELFEDVTPEEEITTQEIYDLYHYSDTGNGGKFYKIVNNKYVETNENIKPNIYYKWVDTLSADKKQETIDNGDGTTTIKDAFVLDLTFDTPQNQNILNEYMVEFISGSKIPGIQIKNVNSEKIYWNSKPSLLQNALHQIHIVNNLGVIVIGV